MIHLVSAANESYAPGLCTTLTSSLLFLSPTESVTFHILNGGLSIATIKKLQTLSQHYHPKCELVFHDISAESFQTWQPVPTNSMMTYARLLLGSLLPTVSKVLYIDADIIVLSNLIELWEVPMNGKMILAARGGAEAILSCDCPWELTEKEKQLPYVNAGVLLIDLNQWRTCSVEQAVKTAIFSKKIFNFHDQTILNYLLRYNIGLITMNWNWQGRIFSEKEATSIKIIHFITPKKPWFWWSDDPRFQLWRAFYKKNIGSPLQLFLKQKAWSGLFYGLFESVMRRCSFLRWFYILFLKFLLVLKKEQRAVTSLKITYDYYATGLGGEKGKEEFQNSRSVLSILRRRF